MIAQDSSDPTGVVDTSPRGSSGAVRARLRKARAALAMRKDSESWDTIAAVLGYPTARAAVVATEQALEAELSTHEGAEFMRGIASDQLKAILKPALRAAKDPNNPNWLPAATLASRLIAQHTDLHGYAAPKRSINVNPTAAQIEKWLADTLGTASPQPAEADIFGGDDQEPGDVVEAELVD